MKLLRISVIRAIAAVVVGVLLLKYDTAVLKGLTIAMGIMFLIAGVVSLVGWLNMRRKKADFRVMDNGKKESGDEQPMFPIVGLGSVLLGCILSLTQTADYQRWAIYLIGGVLILAALNMVMNLVSAKKMEPVAAWLWVPPLLIIIASVFAIVKGQQVQDPVADAATASTATTILAVTALVCALAELVYSFVLYRVKRRYEKTQAQVRRANEMNAKAEEAKVVVSE